jgi:hypothetical protein
MSKLRELIAKAWADGASIKEAINYAVWIDSNIEAVADLIDAANVHIAILDEHKIRYGDDLFPKTAGAMRDALDKLKD